MDAAERYAGIFSAHSAGDRLCDRGLADSGRADEADYLTADIGCERAHRHEFEYALLDLFEPVVICLKYLVGAGKVEVILCIFSPRQVEAGLKIVPAHRRLGRLNRVAFEPVALAKKLLF